MNPKTNTAGYSLTEILVALVISSILMYGVISIMISSKRTYALQDEMAKLQDNARFAMEDLAYSLRMTGFKGCSGGNDQLQNPFLLKCDGSTATNLNMIDGDPDQPITYDDGKPFPNAKSFPPSDTLTLRFLNRPIKFDLAQYMDVSGQTASGQYSPQTLTLSDKVYLSDDSYIPNAGECVMVIDCHTMVKTTVNGSPHVTTADDPLPGRTYIQLTPVTPVTTFKRPIDIFSMKMSNIHYEVRWDQKAQNFALYKVNIDQPDYTQSFIEGVESLQLRYGRQSGGGMVYSESPTGGGNVLSVRITLLMRTVLPRYDLEGSTDKNFFLDTNLIAASVPGLNNGYYNPSKNSLEEHYRHRSFTTTVQLRNPNN